MNKERTPKKVMNITVKGKRLREREIRLETTG
jgi:hypothetical protein